MDPMSNSKTDNLQRNRMYKYHMAFTDKKKKQGRGQGQPQRDHI